MECCIVIPAYEPERTFVEYLRRLRAGQEGPILVVDDGSSGACGPLFGAAAEIPRCTVLHHTGNRGKGAALKTAFAYYLQHKQSLYAACGGVVTADCDGQHAVEDVAKVARATAAAPEALTLGCRTFGEGTPRRSRLGNRVASGALRALYDIDLADSQTGLRGIPNGLLAPAAALPGARYEYELNMLLWAKSTGTAYQIVPIRTIYQNDNAGSHYRPLADSARIVAQLARGLGQYALSSALSAAVDVVLYGLLVKLFFAPWPLARRMLCAAVAARVVSSLVNYGCNRRLPCMQNKRVGATLARYYVLWACQLAASFALTWLLCTAAGTDELWGKYLVDLLLAAASYQIQLRWVFRADEQGAMRRARV